ncbi:glycoside hydrolase family 125 protein [Parashewanella tropica]|uniref:glycoside hydrolase family 125 protein n=1 Tax=Parashewanella tropica TaxID=2547970 RepID=UPI001478B794|nr:glycoside hydrolase family 125 protein [Parashewanella tropica]
MTAQADTPYQRPSNPKFKSDAVESYIQSQQQKLNSPALSALFTRTFPYSLDNTVFQQNVDTATDIYSLRTYVVTGADIQAMWLRDSTNQLTPYAFLISKDERLFKLLVGLANAQAEFVLKDSFANAYVVPNGANSTHTDDQTYKQYQQDAMHPPVFERKFEPDSLAAVLKLQRVILENASTEQKQQLIDDIGKYWMGADHIIVNVLNAWTGDFDDLTNPTNPYYYYFSRPGANALNTLENGVGKPSKTTGLVRTLFRPSDDATALPFNIPVNFMIASELKRLATQFTAIANIDNQVTPKLIELSNTILQALKVNSTEGSSTSTRYSYELDGFGNRKFMDDGNIPSLLSLPVIAPNLYDTTIYLQTRKQILSSAMNPYFFEGNDSIQSGVGSPHTGQNRIWPLSLISQAESSTDENEIRQLLAALIDSSQKNGLIYESYSSSNYQDITRESFAWANAEFANFVIWLIDKHPNIVLKS